MRLAVWARRHGITYRTAWRYYKKGLLPGAYRLPSGTLCVPDETTGIIKKDYNEEKGRGKGHQKFNDN